MLPLHKLSRYIVKNKLNNCSTLRYEINTRCIGIYYYIRHSVKTINIITSDHITYRLAAYNQDYLRYIYYDCLDDKLKSIIYEICDYYSNFNTTYQLGSIKYKNSYYKTIKYSNDYSEYSLDKKPFINCKLLMKWSGIQV